MTNARLASLPIDHVLAEMAVLPLASEAALRLGITHLDPNLSDNTASLWREAERQILSCFPAFSVDEAVSIRDYFWFGRRDDQIIPLHKYLKRLAEQFLEVRGHTATPALPHLRGVPGPSDREPQAVWARLAWRWLSFALPPDLLLAALARDGKGPQEIDLLTPTLDQHLRDKGYAETHLHIGAALEFPLLWASAVRTIAETGFKEKAFESPGAGLNEGKEFAPWLLRAAIARYVLAAFLSWGQHKHEDFKEFMQAMVIPKALKELGPVSLSSMLLGLSELRSGNIDVPGLQFSHLKGLYAQLLGGGLIAKAFPNELEKAREGDPISVFFPGEQNPEMQLVAKGLAYLEAMPEDHYFSVLFWQTIRIRALFYRHVVQRPMTPGLQWFVRFYGRISPARRPVSTNMLVASAATLGGASAGLRSLEFRTSPDSSRSESLQYIKSVDEAVNILNGRISSEPMSCAHISKPEVGLVLHFTKDRGGEALKGKHTAHWRWSHADPSSRIGKEPSGNPTGYRYARIYNAKRNEALSLGWTLWHFPISLELIRGLDVCTDELGVPTWVLAPLFRYVRETSEAASAVLRRHYDSSCVPPPIRTTAHAGEDFVHLLTGLRNVEEAMRRLELREGDRIGHGMALGVDPRDWSQRAGRIPVCREDRLFDLAWEWAWYAREEIDPPSGRAPMLEREIARLSSQIFHVQISPYQIEQFVDYLYDEKVLCLLGFPNGRLPPELNWKDDIPLRLLQRYLTDWAVFDRGKAIEWIDPSSEGEVLAQLQAGIRSRIGQRSITVEVNPSSNLLLGDLCDLTCHPLWRLNPPKGAGDAPPVSICIGSDDPLTFATNLRQEYQFVHDALTIGGLSEEETCHWLDQVRDAGLRSRFTVSRKLGFTTSGKFPFEPRQIRPVFNFEKSVIRLPP